MIVTLKKNQVFDGEKYLKHEEFFLIGINWDEESVEKYYIRSKNGNNHTVDSSLFEQASLV